MQSWAQSFDKLMHSPAGRSVFRAFLRTEYSEENMLFWLACEELKTEANQHVVDEKARLIYEDYVSILSPKEVRWFLGWIGLAWGGHLLTSVPQSTGEPRLPSTGGHQQEDAGAICTHV